MIESPVLDEVKALIRVYTLRDAVLAALEARFGPLPADRLAPLREIEDGPRVEALLRLAVTCPSIDAFVGELTSGK